MCLRVYTRARWTLQAREENHMDHDDYDYYLSLAVGIKPGHRHDPESGFRIRLAVSFHCRDDAASLNLEIRG